MKVLALGTGDAFTLERNNTCFLVEHDDFWLGIDCPHPYLKILKQRFGYASPSVDDFNDFIITHLHGDHVSGLDTLLFFRKFVLGKTTDVYGDSQVLEELWDHLEPSMGKSFDQEFNAKFFYNENVIPTLPYFTKGPSFIGPFKVLARRTKHYIPSTALLIGLRNQEGWKVGLSSDTAFDLDLIEWLNQADVIIHETGPTPGHAPIEKFSLLSDALLSKIRFAHYSDQLETETLPYHFLQDGDAIQLGD